MGPDVSHEMFVFSNYSCACRSQKRSHYLKKKKIGFGNQMFNLRLAPPGYFGDRGPSILPLYKYLVPKIWGTHERIEFR